MMEDPSQEVRRILVNNSVHESLEYLASVSRTIQESSTSLKAVIGDSYKDLITACDRVVGMERTCRELNQLKEHLAEANARAIMFPAAAASVSVTPSSPPPPPPPPLPPSSSSLIAQQQQQQQQVHPPPVGMRRAGSLSDIVALLDFNDARRKRESPKDPNDASDGGVGVGDGVGINNVNKINKKKGITTGARGASASSSPTATATAAVVAADEAAEATTQTSRPHRKAMERRLEALVNRRRHGSSSGSNNNITCIGADIVAPTPAAATPVAAAAAARAPVALRLQRQYISLEGFIAAGRLGEAAAVVAAIDDSIAYARRSVRHHRRRASSPRNNPSTAGRVATTTTTVTTHNDVECDVGDGDAFWADVVATRDGYVRRTLDGMRASLRAAADAIARVALTRVHVGIIADVEDRHSSSSNRSISGTATPTGDADTSNGNNGREQQQRHGINISHKRELDAMKRSALAMMVDYHAALVLLRPSPEAVDRVAPRDTAAAAAADTHPRDGGDSCGRSAFDAVRPRPIGESFSFPPSSSSSSAAAAAAAAAVLLRIVLGIVTDTAAALRDYQQRHQHITSDTRANSSSNHNSNAIKSSGSGGNTSAIATAATALRTRLQLPGCLFATPSDPAAAAAAATAANAAVAAAIADTRARPPIRATTTATTAIKSGPSPSSKYTTTTGAQSHSRQLPPPPSVTDSYLAAHVALQAVALLRCGSAFIASAIIVSSNNTAAAAAGAVNAGGYAITSNDGTAATQVQTWQDLVDAKHSAFYGGGGGGDNTSGGGGGGVDLDASMGSGATPDRLFYDPQQQQQSPSSPWNNATIGGGVGGCVDVSAISADGSPSSPTAVSPASDLFISESAKKARARAYTRYMLGAVSCLSTRGEDGSSSISNIISSEEGGAGSVVVGSIVNNNSNTNREESGAATLLPLLSQLAEEWAACQDAVLVPFISAVLGGGGGSSGGGSSSSSSGGATSTTFSFSSSLCTDPFAVAAFDLAMASILPLAIDDGLMPLSSSSSSPSVSSSAVALLLGADRHQTDELSAFVKGSVVTVGLRQFVEMRVVEAVAALAACLDSLSAPLQQKSSNNSIHSKISDERTAAASGGGGGGAGVGKAPLPPPPPPLPPAPSHVYSTGPANSDRFFPLTSAVVRRLFAERLNSASSSSPTSTRSGNDSQHTSSSFSFSYAAVLMGLAHAGTGSNASAAAAADGNAAGTDGGMPGQRTTTTTTATTSTLELLIGGSGGGDGAGSYLLGHSRSRNGNGNGNVNSIVIDSGIAASTATATATARITDDRGGSYPAAFFHHNNTATTTGAATTAHSSSDTTTPTTTTPTTVANFTSAERRFAATLAGLVDTVRRLPLLFNINSNSDGNGVGSAALLRELTTPLLSWAATAAEQISQLELGLTAAATATATATTTTSSAAAATSTATVSRSNGWEEEAVQRSSQNATATAAVDAASSPSYEEAVIAEHSLHVAAVTSLCQLSFVARSLLGVWAGLTSLSAHRTMDTNTATSSSSSSPASALEAVYSRCHDQWQRTLLTEFKAGLAGLYTEVLAALEAPPPPPPPWQSANDANSNINSIISGNVTNGISNTQQHQALQQASRLLLNSSGSCGGGGGAQPRLRSLFRLQHANNWRRLYNKSNGNDNDIAYAPCQITTGLGALLFSLQSALLSMRQYLVSLEQQQQHATWRSGRPATAATGSHTATADNVLYNGAVLLVTAALASFRLDIADGLFAKRLTVSSSSSLMMMQDAWLQLHLDADVTFRLLMLNAASDADVTNNDISTNVIAGLASSTSPQQLPPGRERYGGLWQQHTALLTFIKAKCDPVPWAAHALSCELDGSAAAFVAQCGLAMGTASSTFNVNPTSPSPSSSLMYAPFATASASIGTASSFAPLAVTARQQVDRFSLLPIAAASTTTTVSSSSSAMAFTRGGGVPSVMMMAPHFGAGGGNSNAIHNSQIHHHHHHVSGGGGVSALNPAASAAARTAQQQQEGQYQTRTSGGGGGQQQQHSISGGGALASAIWGTTQRGLAGLFGQQQEQQEQQGSNNNVDPSYHHV